MPPFWERLTRLTPGTSARHDARYKRRCIKFVEGIQVVVYRATENHWILGRVGSSREPGPWQSTALRWHSYVKNMYTTHTYNMYIYIYNIFIYNIYIYISYISYIYIIYIYILIMMYLYIISIHTSLCVQHNADLVAGEQKLHHQSPKNPKTL